MWTPIKIKTSYDPAIAAESYEVILIKPNSLIEKLYIAPKYYLPHLAESCST